MNKRIIKASVLAGAVFVLSGFGITACNTGTEPGETNVERSGIRETEDNTLQSQGSRDTADYEHHYDHADHTEHGNNEPGSALGDGAYDQEGKSEKRKE